MAQKLDKEWSRKATILQPMRHDGSSFHCYETPKHVDFYAWPKFGTRECASFRVKKSVLRKLVGER